ncbi:MAG: hypothetical protein M1836_005393 [Candelina mexicana]|nr:MAG: hypothetical protein M1836_005393 [Candelina mexicana]
MEASRSSGRLRTLTLDNGIVFKLTEDRLAAVMAVLQASEKRDSHVDSPMRNSQFIPATDSFSYPVVSGHLAPNQPPLHWSFDGNSVSGVIGHQASGENQSFSSFLNSHYTAPELQIQPIHASSPLPWSPTFDEELQGIIYPGKNAGFAQPLDEARNPDLGEPFQYIQDLNSQTTSFSPFSACHVASPYVTNEPAGNQRMGECTSQYSPSPSNTEIVRFSRKRKEPPPSTTTPLDAASGFGCFPTSWYSRRGCYNPTRRKEAAAVRERGACIRCRWLAYKCSGGFPCTNCLRIRGSSRLWSQPCIKATFADFCYFSRYRTGLKALPGFRQNGILSFESPDDYFNATQYYLETERVQSSPLKHTENNPILGADVKSIADVLGAHGDDFQIMILSSAELYIWTNKPQLVFVSFEPWTAFSDTLPSAGDRFITALQKMLRPKFLSQLSDVHRKALLFLIMATIYITRKTRPIRIFSKKGKETKPTLAVRTFPGLRLGSEATSSKAYSSKASVEHDHVEPQIELLEEAHLHLLQALSYYKSIVENRTSPSDYRPAKLRVDITAYLEHYLVQEASVSDRSELSE